MEESNVRTKRRADARVITTICLIVLLTFVLTPSARSQDRFDAQADQRNGVAARVNGKRITMGEIERILNQQLEGKRSQPSQFELEAARLQIVDSLIDREVLFQRAENGGLLPTEEQVTAAINEQKQQSRMSEEELSRQLKAQNLTFAELREEAKKDLAIGALQEKYAAKIKVSEREVEDYYNLNRQEFVNRRGVALAMIAVDPLQTRGQGPANRSVNIGESGSTPSDY